MAVAIGGVLAGELAAQDPGADSYAGYDSSIEARVWFDRGLEPVLEHGDRVRVYYRSNEDAYVAVFRIDTDGHANLVFPGSPGQDNYVRGERDYRLLEHRATQWYVRDQPGVGYYFIVASPDPLDLSRFEYSRYDGTWDLGPVNSTVYADPFAAMDGFVEDMIPDWEYAAYAFDYAEYRVGSDYEYPRFLCYDCHSYRPYNVWNPYLYACSSFRVVIWDRPWFYPAARYSGRRVVYTRRPVERPRRFTFKERAAGEPDRPLTRRAGVGPGPSTPRRTGRDGLLGADGNPNDRARRSGIGSEGTVPPRRGATIRPSTGTDGGRSAAPPVRRTRPSGGEGQIRQRATTPRGGLVRVREKPVLERRPPSRPTDRVRPPARGGSSGSARPSSGSARPSGGSARPSRPAVRRPSGSVRPSGGNRPSSGAAVRSSRPSRSGGSSARSNPPTRSSPPVRSSPPARSSPKPRRSGSAKPRRGGG